MYVVATVSLDVGWVILLALQRGARWQHSSLLRQGEGLVWGVSSSMGPSYSMLTGVYRKQKPPSNTPQKAPFALGITPIPHPHYILLVGVTESQGQH